LEASLVLGDGKAHHEDKLGKLGMQVGKQGKMHGCFVVAKVEAMA